jgi:hypothetical protein
MIEYLSTFIRVVRMLANSCLLKNDTQIFENNQYLLEMRLQRKAASSAYSIFLEKS